MFSIQIFRAIIVVTVLTYANACPGDALPPEAQFKWSSLASNHFVNSYAASTAQNESSQFINDKQADSVKWQSQNRQPQNPWMNSIFQVPAPIVNPYAPAFVPPLPSWNLPTQLQYQPPTVQHFPCDQNTAEQLQEATPNIFPAPSMPLLTAQNSLQFAHGNYGYQEKRQFLPPPLILYPERPQHVLLLTSTLLTSTEPPNYPTAKRIQDKNLKISKITNENVNEKRPVPPPNTVISSDGGSFAIHQSARLVAMSRAISGNDWIQTISEKQPAVKISINKTLINDTAKTSEPSGTEPHASAKPETTWTKTTSTTTTTTVSATTEPMEATVVGTSKANSFAVIESTTENGKRYGLEISGYGFPSVLAEYGSQTKDASNPTDNYRFRSR